MIKVPNGPKPELFTASEAELIGIVKQVCYHEPDQPVVDWPVRIIQYMRMNGLVACDLPNLKLLRGIAHNLLPPKGTIAEYESEGERG